ncbi:hypothetical protein SeMB42_g04353 [Synchytrium endobioticum]|uniref:Uncharacterized protein n=2 Tax=Synchytrium endobioticum TaxID=286115 RepID=A0A507CYY1_9FUNG|nr:hypothetical protein SeMB42_g05824 [Synchytrium endobioticum]TPX44355.1 hypothetical protein SeMB42_g04353 [Synchytrium endobioticum]
MCSTREKEGRRKTKLDHMIKEEKASSKPQATVLLLGAGAAGKSTVMKQMQLLHARNGQPTFTDAERMQFQEAIRKNILRNMRRICGAMSRLAIPYGSPEGLDQAKLLVDVTQGAEGLTSKAVELIQALWTDAGIQQCLARSNEYHMEDSARYFFDNLARISSGTYTPTDQDILLCRLRTSGVQEVVLEEDNVLIKVVDVGGQRSERRKWIPSFEGATAVLFVAAISEYDQFLEEDESQNRLLEAITLFSQIVSSRWFLASYFILFLNKVDLLAAKYQERGDESVRQYWPDYQGTSFQDVLNFFQAKFLQVNQSKGKMIYTHFTSAIDRSSISLVIDSVRISVMNKMLMNIGLL